MELKATDHAYYCHDANYYVSAANGQNRGRCVYETWEEFKEGWFVGANNEYYDHDYNHCFRYDIAPHVDPDTDEDIPGKFSLSLYMMLQRKGIFRPVYIDEITEEDMPEIEAYLRGCWDYLQRQWQEVSQ